MATETLDELRLQQLLQPFENQNTGITNTSAATNMYTPFTTNQEMVNKDLVEQIIAENQRKANQFNPINFQSIFPTNVQTDIRQQAPLDINRFQNMDLQPGYLDRAGSYPGTNFNFNQPNFFQRMFNKASDIYGSSRDLIGTGISSLANLVTGNPLVGGVMSLLSRMGTPMSEYQMRDLVGRDKDYGDQLSRIYGPGGIMQGYNPVSMFGRGPLESIINRRNKAKSEAIRNKLNEEITKLGGSTDTNLSAYRASRPASERRSTGPAGGGRDNTGGDVGAGRASDQFSNRSGMGRTGY